MLRVAVVENDSVSAQKLSEFIHKYAKCSATNISFQMFDRGDRFLVQYDNNYDLIFMGMDIPGIDGKMPQGDFYQIGPRQMTSVLILGGMFATISYHFVMLEPTNKPISTILFLCQVYCISLLYLQTELFKKSRIQKELETLNFLYHGTTSIS